MKEHIETLAKEYAIAVLGYEYFQKYKIQRERIMLDYIEGIKVVINHPEEFGLVEKEV